MCMLFFMFTPIPSGHEVLAYGFWIAAGYKTMVTIPTIVGGFYASIFSIESTDYWRGGFLATLHIAYRLSS